MQFPVPQFTDVEDTIIGSLTIKQFGIIFGAGTLIFLAYSITKSVVVLVIFVALFGIPAIVLAFGKLNGRRMYNSFPIFLRFLTSPKVMVFYRQASNMPATAKVKEAEIKQEKPAALGDPDSKLAELNKMLERQSRTEAELLKRLGK